MAVGVLVEAAVSVLVEAAVAVLVGPGRNGDRRRWGCWLSRVVAGALAELVEAALVEAVVPMLIEAALGRSSGREQGRPAAVEVPVFARARAGRELGDFLLGELGVSGAGGLRITGGLSKTFCGMNSAWM
jgi:hypothetical protein